ncbi:MAG: rane dipeptidase [Gaiellaceae bacterium]|nr:rane dipeptidase [Gaiellaceae bacterium]
MIVDGHLDLAYNALVDGRDYTRSALDTRAEEAGGPIETTNGRCMVGLPELLAGDVRLIIATLFALPRSEAAQGECGYVNQHGAHEQALAQLGIYLRWAAELDEIDLVQSAADLVRPAGRVGVALLIENADCIRTIDDVELFHRAGVRMVGPAWLVDNEYVVGGLTKEGRELVGELSRLGMCLDVSHLPDGGIGRAAMSHEGMMVASHANPRSVLMEARQLPDFAIKLIAERDGVVGVMPVAWALPANTMDAVCEAIEAVAETAGSARHVAIGSDYDGGFGSEQTPDELDTIADHRKIGEALRGRGWNDDDVAGVLGGNWLRVLGGLYA